MSYIDINKKEMKGKNMIGFAEIKVKTEAELKKDWTMYTCNGWIGINKTTGKKIKCGTYYTLLTRLSIED